VSNLLYLGVSDATSGIGLPAVAVLNATTGELLGSVLISKSGNSGISSVLALPGGFVAADGGPDFNGGQNNSLFIINGKTAQIVSHLTVGTNPFAMAYNPVTKTLYVANTTDDTVSAVALQ
jgi:DNA-binding beta-propeller fold protein YncE